MALDAKATRKLTSAVLAIGAKIAKGADLHVAINAGRSANTRFAVSELTSNGDYDETSVSIAVAFGKRHAATSTNQLDPASLEAAVRRARMLAELAPEDPERMPMLGPQKYAHSREAFDVATEKLPAAARAAAASAAIAPADAAKVSLAGFYQNWVSVEAIANSAGLFGHSASTAAELTVTARTPDGTGSGWAGGFANKATGIDAAAIAKVAIDKAVRSQKPKPLEPGRYTVILEPAAVANLLEFLIRQLDARRADEGRSFFSKPGGGTRLGESLFGAGVTLRTDPTNPATPGKVFDGEGLPLEPITWIDKGKLTALAYSRFWADKQKAKPTGSPHSIELAGGDAASQADLLKGVKRGVLITRFWYSRFVDPQSILATGLTRDGVFLVEDGQITTPVNNFRYNESPVTMLKNLEAATKETVRVPGEDGTVWVPALRTSGFHLASVSDAV